MLLSFFKPDVPKLVKARNVKGLIKALRYGAPSMKTGDEIRTQAAEALGVMGDRAAVPALIALIEGERESPRAVCAAIDSVLALDSECAAPVLCKQMRSSWTGVQATAAKGLGTLSPSSDAVAALMRGLEGSEAVQAASATALARLDCEQALPVLVRALAAMHPHAVDEAVVAFGPRAIPHLRELLRHERPWSRAKAVWPLGKLGWQPASDEEKAELMLARREYPALAALGEQGIDTLLKIARAPGGDKDERMEAIKALGRVKSPTIVEALSPLLFDKEVGVANHAAIALGEQGDPQAVEPLIQVLKTHQDFTGTGGVLTFAAEALGLIGDPRAVDALTAGLQYRTSFVREAAAKALGRIRDLRATEALQQATKDGHSTVREAAERALDEMSPHSRWDSISALLGGLSLATAAQVEAARGKSVTVESHPDPAGVIAALRAELGKHTRMLEPAKAGGGIQIVMDNLVSIGAETAPASRQLTITVLRVETGFTVFFRGEFLR